jgi:hypothetical protein
MAFFLTEAFSSGMGQKGKELFLAQFSSVKANEEKGQEKRDGRI